MSSPSKRRESAHEDRQEAAEAPPKKRRRLARFEAKIARIRRYTDEDAYRTDIRLVLFALWHWIHAKKWAPSVREIIHKKAYDEDAFRDYLRDLEENGCVVRLPRTEKDTYRFVLTELGCRFIERPYVTPLLPTDPAQRRRLFKILREEAADEVELERLRDAFGWRGRLHKPKEEWVRQA